MAFELSDAQTVMLNHHVRTSRKRHEQKIKRAFRRYAHFLNFGVSAEPQINRTVSMGSRLYVRRLHNQSPPRFGNPDSEHGKGKGSAPKSQPQRLAVTRQAKPCVA